MTLTVETAVWSGFRWEDGHRAPQAAEGLPEAMTFDRRPYEQQLERAAARVSELPYDEAEHTGRGLLWPWQWGGRIPGTTEPDDARQLAALLASAPVPRVAWPRPASRPRSDVASVPGILLTRDV